VHFSNSIRPSQCAVPFFVLVLFILPVVGKAQIKITGNTLFSKNEILTITGGRKSGVVAPGSIAALQREYYLRGYIFAKIRLSEGRDGESSEMEIEEGKQARFGRVNLRGSLVYDEAKIEQTMNAVPGQVFNPGILSSGIERLLGMYDEAGYPFIQVWVESLKINPESGTVDVSFFIMDGGKKNLAAVVIDGLSKTKEDLVVSLSGLKTGDTYSAQALKQAAGRLRALRVFTTVSAPRVVMTPDGKGVEAHFDVSEPVRTSLFRVALGYAKEEQQKPRVFNGLAELNLLNMGGRLMDLNLYWQNDGSGRSDTRILFQNRPAWIRFTHRSLWGRMSSFL
jgi:outer membrane protein assembly factor BamA